LIALVTRSIHLKALGLLIFGCSLMAPQMRAGVLPNNAVVDGMTIGDWSAEWWKWVLPISTNHNPMLDADGSFAGVGQPDGSVFLIAATLGLEPGRITRRFSVPEGKFLFLPLTMYEADNVNTPPLSVPELRDQAAGVLRGVTNIFASIDGQEIPNLSDHRAISPVFSVFYASADNLQSYAFGQPIIGLNDPMICDGYWLMIEPLPPGEHVLRFGAQWSDYFYDSEIVDYIKVVPISLAERVEELILLVQGSNFGQSRKRGLIEELREAQAAFEKDHLRQAIAKLREFQTRLRKLALQTDDAITERLMQDAQSIVDQASAQMAAVDHGHQEHHAGTQ